MVFLYSQVPSIRLLPRLLILPTPWTLLGSPVYKKFRNLINGAQNKWGAGT